MSHSLCIEVDDCNYHNVGQAMSYNKEKYMSQILEKILTDKEARKTANLQNLALPEGEFEPWW